MGTQTGSQGQTYTHTPTNTHRLSGYFPSVDYVRSQVTQIRRLTASDKLDGHFCFRRTGNTL